MNIQSITATNIRKLPKMNSILRRLLNRIKPICVILFCMVLNNLITFDSIAQNLGKDTLRFLGNKNIAPVVFQQDNMPAGVAVDIVLAIAKHVSRPIDILAMDWQKAQALVANGEADALIQINETEERIKIYDFSDPLLESQFSIFVRSDRVGISGISSLRGLHVGVEAGGLPRELLDKNPNIPLTIIPNFLEGFKLLNKGTIDAVVVDYRVGSYILAENNIRNIKVSGEPIAFSYSAIAVKKGNKILLDNINNALRVIKSDGTYQKIIDKWKTKETVFYTLEQITNIVYVTVLIILSVILLVFAFWMVTLRKQLIKRKAAEEKVSGQYSTLRAITDSTDSLIFSVDKQYCYTSFNIGHADVMRAIYSAEIENGKSLLNYMTVAEDREIAKLNIDRALAGEKLIAEALSGEEHLSRKYFQVSHSPIRSVTGEIIGVAVLAHNITERKHTEQQLTLVNFALDHVREAAFLVDEDALFHYVNQEACRVLGCSRDELLKLSVSEIDPDFPLSRWSSHWKELQMHRSLTFESRHQTKNGHIFPVEINTNYFEYEGKGYSLALSRDITERKRVETELKEQMDEINRFNKLMLGREEKMILLKKEINNLLEKEGKPKRYDAS